MITKMPYKHEEYTDIFYYNGVATGNGAEDRKLNL